MMHMNNSNSSLVQTSDYMIQNKYVYLSIHNVWRGKQEVVDSYVSLTHAILLSKQIIIAEALQREINDPRHPIHTTGQIHTTCTTNSSFFNSMSMLRRLFKYVSPLSV